MDNLIVKLSKSNQHLLILNHHHKIIQWIKMIKLQIK